MTKTGGVSWNKSPKGKRGVLTRFPCQFCKRHYKMEWAKDNHEKTCPEKSRWTNKTTS